MACRELSIGDCIANSEHDDLELVVDSLVIDTITFKSVYGLQYIPWRY